MSRIVREYPAMSFKQRDRLNLELYTSNEYGTIQEGLWQYWMSLHVGVIYKEDPLYLLRQYRACEQTDSHMTTE